jgi:hypothetical protein
LRVSSIVLLGCWIACQASTALALSNRTFVSGTGADAGACSVAVPCRTFGYAISQTNAGGEILVLSSAGYGPLTIAKSIVAPTGIYAGVTATGGLTGITINVGPSGVVTPRGLTITGIGGGHGIHFIAGAVLRVDGVDVSDFGGGGKVGLFVTGAGRIFARDSRWN